MIDFKKIKAFIFDMDGVITDSEYIHMEAERETCKEMKISVPLKEWEKFNGRTAIDIARYIMKNYTDGGISPEEFVKRKSQIYLDIAPQKIQAIPGSIDFIEKISKKNYTLALTTSSAQSVQKLTFDKYGLWPYFQVIVTGDQINQGKPHPEPYILTAEKTNYAPIECAVIEDSDNGILSAKAAGCWTIGITTSFDRKKLEDVGADIVVKSFEELGSLIA